MVLEKEQKFSLTKLLAWFRNCEPVGGSAQSGIISRDAVCNRLLPTVKSAAVVRCFAGGGFFLARTPMPPCRYRTGILAHAHEPALKIRFSGKQARQVIWRMSYTQHGHK